MKQFLVINFLLMISLLSAQTIKPTQTIHSNYIGQKHGLLQLNVKGMAIDDLGYLWVGTEDGLHRFNGYEFKSYLHNPSDSKSITDDHIRSLLFTKDTLWIATNSTGISGFIPSENKFFNAVETKNNIDLNTSYKIFKLNENLILFSVKNNLIIYDRHSRNSRIIRLPKTTKENYVIDILPINDNKYWLATTASGILELNYNTLELNKTTILNNQDIRCFYKHENNIYIGTKNGLFVYNSLTNHLNKTSLPIYIKCFYKLDSTHFYIGTDNGMFLYDLEETSIIPFAFRTEENKLFEKIDINHITGDTKGNLWIGTEGEGLFHYNIFQKKFNTLKLDLNEYQLTNNISSFQFLKGEDSTLWIGCKHGIVKYSFFNHKFQFYEIDKRPLIYTITRDKNNTIWAGGFTSGLLKYDSQSDKFEKIANAKNALPDNDVIEIISIDSTILWVCTWAGGIHKFDIKKEQFEEVMINGERLNRARTSLIDSKGNIWLGTDQGAYKISKLGAIHKYCAKDTLEQKLSGERIFSIKEDYSGNIWFGTNVGLTKLDIANNKTTLYYKQKGLPNDFIYAVLIAENNDIWVSTNFGISVLDFETQTFKNYTTSDGLQNNEFNGKAGYKDIYGNFHFGGISGINIFKPNAIPENPFVPETYIESVDLFNKPLHKNELYKDTLEFKSKENVLTFNFSALNFLNPEKCNYTYIMEGFDSDWRPATKNRSTTYTNLFPGEYTFKVKASNDAGVWNDTPDTMVIIVVPPWYLTTAFIVSFIVLFLLSGIIFYFYKTNKLKKDKLKLERIITQRTKDIRDKNEALKQAYNEAEEQHNSIRFLMRELSHRVKNNLQIISSLLNIQANSLESKSAINALKMAKNRILAISHIENKISSENENLQLDLFIKDLSDSILQVLADDEHLKFKITYNLPHIHIKNLNSTILGLILNELITNTTKYAFDDYKPENRLNISCKIDDKSLKLIVSDNGKGYSIQKDVSPNSMGIELVSEMVQQLKGTLVINTENGTENIIDIPI